MNSRQYNYSQTARSSVLGHRSCAEGLFQPSGASLRLLGMALQNQRPLSVPAVGLTVFPLACCKSSGAAITMQITVLPNSSSPEVSSLSLPVYTVRPLLCTCSCGTSSVTFRCPGACCMVSRARQGKGYVPRSQLARQLNLKECAGIGKMLLHAAF